MVEHRAAFVPREEVESPLRDSCSFPTLTAYERSQRHRPAFCLLPRPAGRAAAARRGQREKTQETGRCPGLCPGGIRVQARSWFLSGQSSWSQTKPLDSMFDEVFEKALILSTAVFEPTCSSGTDVFMGFPPVIKCFKSAGL